MDSERRRDMNARIDASLARGDATGWFEDLYATARAEDDVPWADGGPNAQLVSWLEASRPPAEGRRALVVGAGLGDDAEALAAYGFATTAFDISPTAVEWARRRFPDSAVEYRQADALDTAGRVAGRLRPRLRGLHAAGAAGRAAPAGRGVHRRRSSRRAARCS